MKKLRSKKTWKGSFNKLRNKINEQKYFTKESETIKNQILELKISINEMKNALESAGNKADYGRELMN